MTYRNHDDETTQQVPRGHQPTTPLPPEPEDVDALLAESLKAQSEADFTWKEPERKPRWWERAEAQAPRSQAVSPGYSGEVAASSSPAGQGQGIRLGSVIFGLVALVLAGWVVASVVFGFSVDPLVVGLVICSLAGISLVAAGLRPKPGTRI
ncbi:hypothetical protein [Nesterenkonia alkaliphila]|uniref:Uncharacterized protein n=1 Tax=Nesterenkonia alkaliphila TaxID=1463631 RepID=A0A7K1UL63_9MICC|nr:hypothetical protein [Nesterenkonia alkaliphila]MVT27199.1 hypothetical protein [Nesterenkonia alkaliphila]GFZ78640.1 hypothetical protein GCM10011359_03700 [Nesterenkonia alkaliphila]